VTLSGTVTGAPASLVDNTSQTSGALSWLRVDLPSKKEDATFYTLTSGKGAGDPTSWVLKGSYDGTNWTAVDERSGEAFAWRQQTRAFKIARPGHYQHYRLEFPGSVTVAEFELLAKPFVTCSATVTGEHAGALRVESGVTCVDGATVTGPVTVAAGASLYVFGGKVDGPVNATGAAAVVLVETSVGGPVNVTGTTGRVSLERVSVGGPVRLVDNKGGTVVAGNTVGGPLSCTGSNPGPVNNGWVNSASGPKTGQCAGL
jgi:hypothetical protein